MCGCGKSKVSKPSRPVGKVFLFLSLITLFFSCNVNTVGFNNVTTKVDSTKLDSIVLDSFVLDSIKLDSILIDSLITKDTIK